MEWLYFKTPVIKIDIDSQAVNFGHSGEFSPEADKGFDEHINRLKELNKDPKFAKMNGCRLYELNRSEPFRYWRP